jgi:opacity protein-like surface antigen
MRRRLILAASLVSISSLASLAHAGRITVGAAYGLTQSQADAQTDSSADPNHAIGLFARVGLLPQLSLQLDVTRIDTDASDTDIRTGTVLAVIDLTHAIAHGRLVPIVLGGAGLDRVSTDYENSSYHHFEAGAGLEYRAGNGLVLGADARVGTRSQDSSSYTAEPIAVGSNVALYVPSSLSEGQYRAVRLTVGLRF